MQPDQRLSCQKRIEAFPGECRRRGLRLTHQRLEVYRELASTVDHPSVETIYRRVLPRLPTISLDTVYRTLSTFEDSGLIRRIHAFDDRARFDADISPHQHLVCTHCRGIQDLNWGSFADLEPPREARKWGEVESKHAVLKGICSNCLKKAST